MKRSRIQSLLVAMFCVLCLGYVISTYSAIKKKRRLTKSALVLNQPIDWTIQIHSKKNQTSRPDPVKFSTPETIADSVTETRTNFCIQDPLIGQLTVDINKAEDTYWKDLGVPKPENESATYLGNFTSFVHAADGGVAVFHGPINSTTVQRVAIIVPFRDRERHLRIFLGHLLSVLQRQGNIFSIFVVEQIGNETFNKGRVMNSGFQYASSVRDIVNASFDCYIFHDVDLLVENDNLIYRCSKDKIVVHLSPAISKFDYKPVCCGMTVGGALGLTSDQYVMVNGFPNSLWGWGGEDDAIEARIKKEGLVISRPTPDVGRFTMMKHERDKLNPYNNGVFRALKVSIRKSGEDGLSSLHTKIVTVERYATYVKVLVDVGKP